MSGICDECEADNKLFAALKRISRLETAVAILKTENSKLRTRIAKKEETISILRES